MKRIITNISLFLLCTACIAIILFKNSSKTIEANKVYSSKDSVNEALKTHLFFVNSDEKELWGYEPEDNLEDLWIGEPIPLYDLEDSRIVLTNIELYPVYAGEHIRTAIEMEDDVFFGSFWFGYIEENIAQYNEIKSQNPYLDDYKILIFWNQYLLFYQDNKETYFIGSTRLFDWPSGEGNPCHLSDLLEAIQKRSDYYNDVCPEHNCLGI